MGPCRMVGSAMMAKALINWHTEMQRLGLADKGSISMAEFVDQHT